MAEDTTYQKPPTSSEPTIGGIDWLELWPTKTDFKDEASKEAYKGLVRIYLSTWLSLYNSHPSRTGKQPYEIKEFGEKPTGPTAFRPFALLTPAVQKHVDIDADGGKITHLIPPEPPPPPKDELV